MHPLFNENLKDLSDDALHKKHGELLKRINQAGRLGYVDVIHQLQLINENFKNEITRRNLESMEKMRKSDSDFDNYINIG